MISCDISIWCWLSEVRAKLAEQGTEPLGSTPEEYGRILREETDRWGRVIAESGVRLD